MVKLPDNAKTAMSMVAAADYDLYFKEGYEPAADVRTFADGIRQYFTEKKKISDHKTDEKSEKSWI